MQKALVVLSVSESQTMLMLTQPDIRPVTDRLYRLWSSYFYQWDLPSGATMRIIVPEGFTYDGATVPRLFWTLSGLYPDGLIRAAALVHDWIYVHKGRPPQGSVQQIMNPGWTDISGKWSRKDCDKLFRRMMIESGMDKKHTEMAYLAVRLGGGYYW